MRDVKRPEGRFCPQSRRERETYIIASEALTAVNAQRNVPGLKTAPV